MKKSRISKSEEFSVQLFISAMMKSGDIRHSFYISYGAMNSVFTYITPKEILFFQAVSLFMYRRGVERLQSRIKMRHTLYFFS